ncbi:hypothetical protein L596_022781 [Steinernema carpocapsae]|uniref:Uncharacterized protein n=1 Tax=Steinernema carpocapsae TaxID=34508 RepID=A0A4U5MMS2_STECR|nr:hypothetical protein L596_022781 [Steinernema carpocapsae]
MIPFPLQESIAFNKRSWSLSSKVSIPISRYLRLPFCIFSKMCFSSSSDILPVPVRTNFLVTFVIRLSPGIHRDAERVDGTNRAEKQL